MFDLERHSNYKREMELLVGTLNGMEQTNGPAAAVIVAYLNKALTKLRKDDWQNLDPKELLMRKNYEVSLKMDFDDPERHKILMHMFRKKAREILTAAQLLADNRPPQIGITVGDFFEGGTVEGLMEVGDHPDDDEAAGEGEEVESET